VAGWVIGHSNDRPGKGGQEFVGLGSVSAATRTLKNSSGRVGLFREGSLAMEIVGQGNGRKEKNKSAA
jgi:hypothetical protein